MMTLKQGKFYNDGVQVPVEFGNNEQLKLIAKSDALREGILVYVVDADDETDACFAKFTCLCGTIVERTFATSEDFDEFETEKIKCNGCNEKYTLVHDDEYSYVYVKYTKK